MKTTKENSEALHYAYYILIHSYWGTDGRKFFDRRTKSGKQAYAYYLKLQHTENISLILEKRRKRCSQKYIFSNVLNNKLYKDWKSNKRSITVYDDRLSEGLRNHWAKNDFDIKVLKILKQYSK